MERDGERSIILVDAERVNGGDHAQGSNVTAVLNSGGSAVKINSLCIDLGIVKEKDNPQKCNHFSIRGYVAMMRERDGNKYLPFSNVNGEELLPIEVPRFRYWRCRSCLQDCGAASTSRDATLVSQNGKTVVQPSATSCPPPLDRQDLAILPFGEGTSGLKPIDNRSDDETILTVLQGDKTQSLPEIRADIEVHEEPSTKIDVIDTIATPEANVGAPVIEENELRLHEGSEHVGIIANGALTCLVVQPVQPDQQNDDPNGHPRRKARKVRLLTELLCRRTQEQHQRNENNTLDLRDSVVFNGGPSSQIKRKAPQVQDRRSVDATSQVHVGKKIKTAKSSIVEHSGDVVAGEGGQKTDEYQCKKHGTQRIDPMAAWRSIISDMGQADELVSAGLGGSRGIGTDPYSNPIPPPHPEKKSNSSKKILENPFKNQIFREDLQNLGGSRVRDRQSDVGLGLDLSLHYDPQTQVRSIPPLPNRVPVQDHNRKAGFFFGEPSINHRVTSDPQAKERSVYEHNPRRTFLQEQQQHYHTNLSFSQHQNLDFSDPHNKRNGGFRGYSDVTRPHIHQRQDMFSNGRSDEKEIVELMAKIQHERNNNGIHNKSGFRKFNSTKGIPAPIPQYPAGIFHQEPVPTFPMIDTFLHYRKHPSNGIRISDSGPPRHHNSHYYEPRGNNKTGHQIMEAFNKYHDGQTPRNVWSNIPTSVLYGHKNKGKNIMNLDLNVTAPNVLDDQNDFEPFDPNRTHMGPLDSSYSNEAIPAMQLLSLMDAGKTNLPFSMDGKKFTPKPFSPCYNHTTPGLQSGVQKTVFLPCGPSPSPSPSHSPTVANTFSSLFLTDQALKGHNNGRQFFHKPQHKKPRGLSSSSSSLNHKYRPDDSFLFPLQWHDATQDRSERVAQGDLRPKNVTLGTGVCAINRNPADFSMPGPENVYMINAEDLIIREERFYKSKFGSERQKR